VITIPSHNSARDPGFLISRVAFHNALSRQSFLRCPEFPVPGGRRTASLDLPEERVLLRAQEFTRFLAGHR
jgi:hypothetical protein